MKRRSAPPSVCAICGRHAPTRPCPRCGRMFCRYECGMFHRCDVFEREIRALFSKAKAK